MRAVALALALLLASVAQAQDHVPLRIVGDGIPQAMTSTPGDASRGRAIVANRTTGLCLLCHSAPIPEERFQGNLAPDLSGSGSRWTVAQLRLRVADAAAINPDTIMPPFHRTGGLVRVSRAFAGKPILTAQQVEDVVSYLASLR